MPDFDVTIVYEGNIETGYSRSNASGINEQDGMVVTLGNWLNGRLSCEQIEQLWCEFFPAPLAKQKEAQYNMTKRTKMVMFKEAQAWLFPITILSSSARRC